MGSLYHFLEIRYSEYLPSGPTMRVKREHDIHERWKNAIPTRPTNWLVNVVFNYPTVRELPPRSTRLASPCYLDPNNNLSRRRTPGSCPTPCHVHLLRLSAISA